MSWVLKKPEVNAISPFRGFSAAEALRGLANLALACGRCQCMCAQGTR